MKTKALEFRYLIIVFMFSINQESDAKKLLHLLRAKRSP